MWTSARSELRRVLSNAVLSPDDLRRGWPSPPQEEMLQVVLSKDEALPRWRAWQEKYSLEDVKVDVHRVIPALYDRLAEEGVEGGPHLRGVARHCYVSGALHLREAERMASFLDKAGITNMAMKGLAVSVMTGRTWRHMSDFDMMVPYEDAEKAVRAVMSDGWTSGTTVDEVLATVGKVHSAGFLRGSAGFDLHWHSNHQDQSDAFDGPVLERSTVCGAHRVPSKTDLLLQTAIHGMRVDSRGHVWPLDAAIILSRVDGPVLWDQILETAVRRRLVVQARSLAETLSYFVPGSVPQPVVDALSAACVTSVEVLEHRGICHPSGKHYVRRLESDALWTMRETRRSSEDVVPPVFRLGLGAGPLRPSQP